MESLGIYGADLSRWPNGASEAREALLADPNFRRAWEEQRRLDHALAAYRDELDGQIAASRAATRLVGRLSRVADPLGGFRWGAVAAAVLVAAALGSAVDLALVDRVAEPLDPVETVMLDPLATLDEAEIR
jgi:hypothetical protein